MGLRTVAKQTAFRSVPAGEEVDIEDQDDLWNTREGFRKVFAAEKRGLGTFAPSPLVCRAIVPRLSLPMYKDSLCLYPPIYREDPRGDNVLGRRGGRRSVAEFVIGPHQE